MEDKFIMVNDCIIRKKEIAWIRVKDYKVEIGMINKDIITSISETEEDAQDLFQNIWRILK